MSCTCHVQGVCVCAINLVLGEVGVNGINHALGGVIIHVLGVGWGWYISCPAGELLKMSWGGGGGGGGGINHVLGQALIHVLGVGMGNDISHVHGGGGAINLVLGVCVCVCV